MKTVILLSLAIYTICSQTILHESYLQVKSKAKWETYNIHENPFKDYSEDQLKFLLGTNLIYNENNSAMLIDNDDHTNEENLPREFDSRKQWPECISQVRKQEHCGSCWAFSGSSTLSDRFCIASNGTINNFILSPQDLVSCDNSNYACQGGLLDKVWKYFENVGVVQEKCLPYVSGDGKNIPQCPHGICIDNSLKYMKYKAVDKSSKPLTCPFQIKKELMENGPIQTGFNVYEDFMHYKSGVYEFTHGKKLGGHAVKIVGWGVENGKEYWIAQNSWGVEWGEMGFFRIKFGECMFDSNGFAGLAKLNDFSWNNFLFLD